MQEFQKIPHLWIMQRRLFDKVIDLNVKGVFNATRVAAECMVARGKGAFSQLLPW